MQIAPKLTSEHLKNEKFPGGACPQTPLAWCMQSMHPTHTLPPNNVMLCTPLSRGQSNSYSPNVLLGSQSSHTYRDKTYQKDKPVWFSTRWVGCYAKQGNHGRTRAAGWTNRVGYITLIPRIYRGKPHPLPRAAPSDIGWFSTTNPW